jgi:uncharacterized protein with HEPN domain
MTQHDDLVYLGDMLDSTRAVLRWTEGRDEDAFMADDMLQSAVAHQVQTIGEAASKVSAEFRAAHPEIAWQDMVGMRNIIVHNYRRVMRAVLWRLDLTPLIDDIRRILPPEQQ